jgi:transitional endoplasmic reticulum ATPase
MFDRLKLPGRPAPAKTTVCASANCSAISPCRALAVVILEALSKHPTTPPLAFVLYARLLASAGEVDEAVRQYRRGVKADPGVADREFAERLGIRSADEFEAEFDPETSEVIDGRVRSAWSERAQGSTIEVDRPILSFSDVGGMESVK